MANKWIEIQLGMKIYQFFIKENFFFMVEKQNTVFSLTHFELIEKESDGNEGKIFYYHKEEPFFSLKPVFYDMPLLFVFKDFIRIPPKKEIDFYLPIDLRYEIFFGKNMDILVTKGDMIKKKRAWLGDMKDGFFTYFFSGNGITYLNKDRWNEHQIMIPVRIKNESEDERLIDELIVSNRYLNCYSSSHGLVSDIYSCAIDNSNKISLTNIKKPDIFHDLNKVNEHREKFIKNSLLKNKAL